MADFRAISGVSRSLRNLLTDRMEQAVSVTVAPPDVEVSGMTGSRVNLYLYQVKENGYLKNQEIPSQGHPADYGHPPLSLDLHYLLTTFAATETAADADLNTQQTLGDAMRVFHDYPVITEDLHQNDNPADPRIQDPSLLGEFEQVRVTLEPREMDEISGLWSGLPEAAFRRSVSYRCSVVQIESQRARRSVRPVRERRVYAFPLNSPHIDEIVRDPPFPNYPIRTAFAEVGDTILVIGRNLRSDSTRVILGTEVVNAPNSQGSRIPLTVPATLSSGLHAVHVVHDLLLDVAEGDPPVAHRGVSSNAVPFMVIPQLSGLPPGPVSAGDTISVTVNPPAEAQQEKVLLLNDTAIQAESVPPDSPPSATVDFRIPDGSAALPAGTYLVRIRVAGAESLLTVDPVSSQFVGPTLAVAP